MHLSPTSDVKWCLDQFFIYLELHVKHRVSAKMGRARTLEASKLSNLSGNAALAHPNKARTSLTSARSWHNSVPINITAYQKQHLREIFIYYCGWSERHNYMYMSRTQFLRFCRDIGIMGDGVDGVALNLLFQKIHTDSPDNNPGVRFSLADWLQAILRISLSLHEDCTIQDAFDNVVGMIIQHAPKPGSRREDTLATVMLREEVLEILQDAESMLKPVYGFYVNQQELKMHDSTRHSSGVHEAQKLARSRLPFDSFLHFAQDFELMPRIITKSRLCEAFRCSRFGPAGSSPAGDDTDDLPESAKPQPEDLARICFAEFVDAVGRLALMAFNFQEPAEPAPTLGFNGCYQAAAKSLWLEDSRQARAEELKFPDEVFMPAARDGGYLGIEDKPKPMDDMMSRAASRAFSRAQSTFAHAKPVASSPGLEVMEVHNEATSPLHLNDRPLHLAPFTSEWVGRPAMPLGEASRQRTSRRTAQPELPGKGWYSADLDLPPKYVERMQFMIEARINREQMTDGLKLSYHAEHRRQVMASLENTKEKRRMLQTFAGQKLDGRGLSPEEPTDMIPQWLTGSESSSGANRTGSAGGRSGARSDAHHSMLTGTLSSRSTMGLAAQRVLEWTESVRSGSVAASAAYAAAGARRHGLESGAATPAPTETFSVKQAPLAETRKARRDTSKSGELLVARHATLLGELQGLTKGLSAVKLAS